MWIDRYIKYHADGTIDSSATQDKFNENWDEYIKKHPLSEMPPAVKESFAPKKNGSAIAKSGYESENNMIAQFSDWRSSGTALEIIGQLCDHWNKDILSIDKADAYLWKSAPDYLITKEQRKSKQHKTDMFFSVKFRDECEPRNISVSQKRATIGFNQLDRGKVSKFNKLLGMPDDVVRLMELFTGERPPSEYGSSAGKYDDRRMYIDELNKQDQEIVLSWFRRNSDAYIKYVFLGDTGAYPPEYMLIEKVCDDGLFYNIAEVGKIIGLYDPKIVCLSKPNPNKRTGSNIYLGGTDSKRAISIQRKGGDGGEKGAKDIQTKFNSLSVFERLSKTSSLSLVIPALLSLVIPALLYLVISASLPLVIAALLPLVLKVRSS